MRVRHGLLAVAMMALLVACGHDPATPPASASTPAPSPSAVTTTAASPFCRNLASFWVLASQTLGDVAAGKSVAPAVATQLSASVATLTASAPPDIQADLATYLPALQLISREATSPMPDFATQLSTIEQSPAFITSAIRLSEYAQNTCGLTINSLIGAT